MNLQSVDFTNTDGTLSHWSVCECDADGTPIDVATGLMHATREECEAERRELSNTESSAA